MHKITGALLCALLALCASSAWSATGEDTFKAVCASCHAQNMAGSPQVGDTKAWAKLTKEGQINLTADGYVGVRGMPARGGRSDLSVNDFANAVAYMANHSGSQWQEPDEAMLKKIIARIDKRQMAKK